jgi:hypothetical protein
MRLIIGKKYLVKTEEQFLATGWSGFDGNLLNPNCRIGTIEDMMVYSGRFLTITKEYNNEDGLFYATKENAWKWTSVMFMLPPKTNAIQ